METTASCGGGGCMIIILPHDIELQQAA